MINESVNPEVDPEVNPTEPESEPKPADKESSKPYSREDIAKIVSAQVKQHDAELKEREDKLKQEMAEQISKAKEEGAEEAKMTAEQLAKKKAEEQEAELKSREERIRRAEAELSTKTLMASKKLPDAVADVMLAPLTQVEADKREAVIDKVNEAISEAVQAGVLEKTKGKVTPNTGNGTGVKKPDKPWDEMTYSEQVAIYRENPELAEQLLNK